MKLNGIIYSLSQCALATWILGAPVLGLSPTLAIAEGATHCIVARTARGGGTELYNSCDAELEVTWCTYEENDCAKYNNTWTIGPGETYPVGHGGVQFIACVGRDSIRHVGAKRVQCD